MATPRSPFVAIGDSLLDEPWPYELKAALVMLSCHMHARWRSERRLTLEDVASEHIISIPDLAKITGVTRQDIALGRIGALSERLDSMDVSLLGGGKPLVYAMHTPRRGLVKIGRTLDVDRRLSQLRAKEPDIRIHAVYPTWQMVDVERAEHRRWSHLKVSGEWFEASEEILSGTLQLPWVNHRLTTGQPAVITRATSGQPCVVVRWPKWAEYNRTHSRSPGSSWAPPQPQPQPKKKRETSLRSSPSKPESFEGRRPRILNLLSKLPGDWDEKESWWSAEGPGLEATAEAEGTRPEQLVVRWYRHYLRGEREHEGAGERERLRAIGAEANRETPGRWQGDLSRVIRRGG